LDRNDLRISLLEDLFASPGSEVNWTRFLAHLCDALDGSAASFISHRFTSNEPVIALTARTHPEALAKYNDHWHRFDPWGTSPVVPSSRSGTVVYGEQFIAADDFKRTAFFNEFGRFYGLGRCLAGVIEASPAGLSCISIDGHQQRQPFSGDDATLLASLLPAVQRAIELHRRLAGVEILELQSAAVLDRTAHGVILLDGGGRILSTNAAADGILRARDGLRDSRGELRAATVSETTRLHRGIAEVLCGAAPGRDGEVLLSLARPGNRRPLTVLIAALPAQRRALVADAARAIMFVTDPDRVPVPDETVIGRVLDLTQAEARLAASLTGGATLQEAASLLGITVQTARSRLKVIFNKTDTHRQSDLVRLVLSSAPPGSGGAGE
jgi:DNA-binding CsgD family transcriptional regulator